MIERDKLAFFFYIHARAMEKGDFCDAAAVIYLYSLIIPYDLAARPIDRPDRKREVRGPALNVVIAGPKKYTRV